MSEADEVIVEDESDEEDSEIYGDNDKELPTFIELFEEAEKEELDNRVPIEKKLDLEKKKLEAERQTEFKSKVNFWCEGFYTQYAKRRESEKTTTTV